MSIKLKRSNQKKDGNNSRQRRLIATVLVFVLFVMGFGYMLSKTEGKITVKGSKEDKIEIKDNKIVDKE